MLQAAVSARAVRFDESSQRRDEVADLLLRMDAMEDRLSAANGLIEALSAKITALTTTNESLERRMRHHFGIDEDAKMDVPTIRHIQRAVCDEFGVSLEDLLSARRPEEIIGPRHAAMYLAKELTLCSLNTIGRATGGRDHRTIMYAVYNFHKRMKADPEFCRKVETVRAKIKAEFDK